MAVFIQSNYLRNTVNYKYHTYTYYWLIRKKPIRSGGVHGALDAFLIWFALFDCVRITHSKQHIQSDRPTYCWTSVKSHFRQLDNHSNGVAAKLDCLCHDCLDVLQWVDGENCLSNGGKGDIGAFFSKLRIGVNYTDDEENYTPSNFLGSEGLSCQSGSF